MERGVGLVSTKLEVVRSSTVTLKTARQKSAAAARPPPTDLPTSPVSAEAHGIPTPRVAEVEGYAAQLAWRAVAGGHSAIFEQPETNIAYMSTSELDSSIDYECDAADEAWLRESGLQPAQLEAGGLEVLVDRFENDHYSMRRAEPVSYQSWRDVNVGAAVAEVAGVSINHVATAYAYWCGRRQASGQSLLRSIREMRPVRAARATVATYKEGEIRKLERTEGSWKSAGDGNQLFGLRKFMPGNEVAMLYDDGNWHNGLVARVRGSAGTASLDLIFEDGSAELVSFCHVDFC